MRVPANTILVSINIKSLYTNIPQEEGGNIVMQRLQSIPEKRTSYPYTTTAKSNQTYLSGELLPIKWRKLSANT